MRTRWTACLVSAVVAAHPASAEDVLGVATVAATAGQVRDVAVTVRDVAGTLLDEGDGPSLEIQGFAFRVDFAPPQHVLAVTFLQAGVTAGHIPLFPVILPSADHIIVLMSFDEATEPLTFQLNAAPPGDPIGLLRFTLSSSAPPGTLIALTLAPASATLVNGDATLEETVANGHLLLADGAIVIDAAIFSSGFESGDFSGWSLVVGG